MASARRRTCANGASAPWRGIGYTPTGERWFRSPLEIVEIAISPGIAVGERHLPGEVEHDAIDLAAGMAVAAT
jgi:hypothetical protein